MALFDKDPDKVGSEIGDALKVRPYDDLEKVIREEDVVVGVLAVPTEAAQEVADDLVQAGVKIIFNYSEALLQVPPEVTVHTSSPAVDLLYALYFYLTETSSMLDMPRVSKVFQASTDFTVGA